MTDGWLPDEEWEHVQRVIPIVCVDVLALRHGPTGQLTSLGLIQRHTPDGVPKWCLVGGRVRYGESIPAAVVRHIRDSLGGDAQFDISRWQQPLYVAQYAPSPCDDFLPDPRKHAVALTYALELVGEPDPRGEALDFQWFPAAKLPAASDFGFAQDRVVAACIARLAARA